MTLSLTEHTGPPFTCTYCRAPVPDGNGWLVSIDGVGPVDGKFCNESCGEFEALATRIVIAGLAHIGNKQRKVGAA